MSAHEVNLPQQGVSLLAVIGDGAEFWRQLTNDSQLRWLGPEKGVIHLATAALVNAVWDLWAKVEGKPLWQLVADLTPEQFRGLGRLYHRGSVLFQVGVDEAEGAPARGHVHSAPAARQRQAQFADLQGGLKIAGHGLADPEVPRREVRPGEDDIEIGEADIGENTRGGGRHRQFDIHVGDQGHCLVVEPLRIQLRQQDRQVVQLNIGRGSGVANQEIAGNLAADKRHFLERNQLRLGGGNRLREHLCRSGGELES